MDVFFFTPIYFFVKTQKFNMAFEKEKVKLIALSLENLQNFENAKKDSAELEKLMALRKQGEILHKK